MTSGGEEERKIYFRVARSYQQFVEDKVRYDWYAIPDDDGGVVDSDGFLVPVFKPPPKCPSFSAATTLGSYIFVIAGLDPLQVHRRLPSDAFDEVYYIDTRDPDKGWLPGPPLIAARSDPFAAVIDGRILVLGGLPRDKQRGAAWGNGIPYAEFFDPNSHPWNWSPYPPPPTDPDSKDVPTNVTSHAILYGENRNLQQLVAYNAFQGVLFSYDFGSQIWSVLDSKIGRWQYQPAFVGDIMYFIHGSVHAYHLRDARWFSEPVDGLACKEGVLPPYDKEYNMSDPSTLVHLGNGVLCLLWTDYTAGIHCTKFTVSMKPGKEPGKCIPSASIKSFQVYKIKCSNLKDCVAVSKSDILQLEWEAGPLKKKDGDAEIGNVCYKRKKHRKRNNKRGNN